MADLLLKDIDPVLNERLLRLGLTRRWSSRDTVVRVLEEGLDAFERAARDAGGKEKDLLTEARDALQDVPSGAF